MFRFKLIRFVMLLVLFIGLNSVSLAAVHNAVDEFDEFNNPSPSGWSYINGGRTTITRLRTRPPVPASEPLPRAVSTVWRSPPSSCL